MIVNILSFPKFFSFSSIPFYNLNSMLFFTSLPLAIMNKPLEIITVIKIIIIRQNGIHMNAFVNT